MNKNALKKILDHPDKDEIISKLVIGITPKDIYDWLSSKYTNASEKKFVVAEKSISSFQNNYLDIYNMIQEDVVKSKSALATNTEEELALSVQNNPAYKSKMLELAGKELDIRKMVANLCVAIETRIGQVFDEIQEDPRNINTKIDRLLIDYAEVLGSILEKYYKFTEEPAQNIVQHNLTLNVMDQHIAVFHDIIKDVLSHMDLEASMYFMETFTERMSKVKLPPANAVPNTDARLTEAKVLSETIDKKING